MKRAIPLLLTIIILFAFPASAGTKAHLPDIAFDGGSAFIPGSIIRFEHLTIEDGLLQNAGLAFFQDSKGYLWIGTQDGLNRYGGYTFKIFKHDPDDPNPISHNSILTISEDKAGYLWIGTWGGGLNRFDPATETFVSYHNDPSQSSSLSNDVVTSIKEASNGELWVGTLSGLDRYNPQTDSFDHFKSNPLDPDSLSSDAVSIIFEDSHGQLRIGTSHNGINKLPANSGQFSLYRHIHRQTDEPRTAHYARARRNHWGGLSYLQHPRLKHLRRGNLE